MLKMFRFKYSNRNKTRSELVSLITETLPPSLDSNGEFCCSIPIIAPNPMSMMEQQEESELINNEQQEKIGNMQVCRICYSTSDLQSLITPCQCSGTMGALHQNCLERWLEISNTTKCEICQHEYDVIRYPKPLFYFLTNPLRSSDVRYLINDIILFISLTAIVSWLIIISIFKMIMAKTYYDEISFMLLPLSVLVIYVIWCWVTFRYHVRVFKEWRSVNQLIRVVVRTENNKKMSMAHYQRPTRSSINALSSKFDIDQQRALLRNHNREPVSPQNEDYLLPEVRIVKARSTTRQATIVVEQPLMHIVP